MVLVNNIMMIYLFTSVFKRDCILLQLTYNKDSIKMLRFAGQI